MPSSMASSAGSTAPAFGALSEWPGYEADEVAAVARVMADRPQRIGHEVAAFEEEAADYLGVPHAVAFANATVALEACLAVLVEGAKGEVPLPRRAYFACMSSILRAGLTPVAVDVDTDSQNVTPELLAPHLGDRTVAVMTVDMAGWPIDGQGIAEQVAAAGIPVLADCAQALGATRRGTSTARSVTASVYSFCHDKMISSGGEGGLVATADSGVAAELRAWQSHGKRPDPAAPPWVSPPHWTVGTNARLTDVQAAIGRVQLSKLDDWIARRQANAAVLTEALCPIPGLHLPAPGPEIRHTYYKYYAFLAPEVYDVSGGRDEALRRLWDVGIACYQGACSDVFKEPGVPDRVDPGDCPTTVAMGLTSIAFLVPHVVEPTVMAAASTVIAEVLGSLAG